MSTDTSEVVLWDHDKIVTLVYHMREQKRSVDDIVYAVEKPWKFEDEYREAMAERE